MKIFLTGATGYIGSAVARALVRDGHTVVGLTHSRAAVESLKWLGVVPLLGDLRRPESYAVEAGRCEVLIHAAYDYGPQGAETDLRAVETLAALARGARLLIYTSGVWVLGPTPEEPASEASPMRPPEIVSWRPGHENLALSAAGGRARAVVIRPGCVYGESRGLYGRMFMSLFDRRAIDVVGSGSNRWACVYLDDLAELYRLIVDRWPESGVYHATDGTEETLDQVAEALIDAAGGGDIVHLGPDLARRALGPLADALAMDQRVSSEKARRELGWRPALASPARYAPTLLAEWHEKACPMSVA